MLSSLLKSSWAAVTNAAKWNRDSLKCLQNNYINEGEKSKTSFETFWGLVIIISIQSNEQNRRFLKH